MRLLTLELLAYGSFTERVLDLSGGKEGIHLIYGPNEAGKSVALRALTGFLFGIPPRTNDNFLHDNARLRVGAQILGSDGSTLYAVRRKGLKDTLLSQSGDPMPNTALETYLGEMTRDLFSTMFAMDHEVLVEGGKALVDGGGDIGQSLFAAGMGITGMRGMVESLEMEAGDLFKPTGKNPMINRLIQDFKTLKRDSVEKSLSSKDWISHDESMRSASKKKENVSRELLKLSSERNRLDRLLHAIPKIASLLDLRNEVGKMGEVRPLPPEFSKQRQEAQDMLHRAQSSEARLKKDLTKIHGDLSGISPERPLIKAQEEIRDLFLRSGSHKKAMADLPKRRADKHRSVDEAQAILKKLGPECSLENVESLRLTDSLTARIRELGRERDPILGKQEAALREHSELESEILTAEENLSRLASQKDPRGLKTALNQILKQGELSGRLGKIKAELRMRQERLDLQLKRLGSWKGTLGQLESLTPPTDETIDRFEADFNERHSKLQRIEQTLSEQRERLVGLDRQMEALRAVGSIPKVEELEQARKHRDEGWHLVKDAWLRHKVDHQKIQSYDSEAGDLAEGYEKSVRATDQIGDRLRNESERVAKEANFLAERREVEKRMASLDDDLKRSEEEHVRIEGEWKQLWEPIGIRPGRPRGMRAWLQGYQRLMEEVSEHRGHMEEAKALEATIEAHRSLLSERLKELGEAPVGKNENLDSLLDRCDAVVTSLEEAQNRREILVNFIRDLKRRISVAGQNIQQAKETLKSWGKKWGEAVGHLGLGAVALPSEADAVLDRTQELFERIDQAQMMHGRIQAMEVDAENFSKRASELSTRLVPDHRDIPPDELASELNEKLDKALAAAARFEELEKQDKSLEEAIQSEQQIIEEFETKLTEMCREAGVVSYTELPEIETRSDLFREKQEKIANLENELKEYSAGEGIDALIHETRNENYDSLPAEIGALNHHIQALELERSDLDQLIGSEKAVIDAMDGRADAAELAESAQGVLAELRDRVERYARVRVASILLRKEIERYREANQGPILKRAGEIFADLTLNSFKGLLPDFGEKDNPILLGVRPTNEKVPVEGMSDGTSDQLYLSLRFASLELRFLDGEPMPLILDDILINFDDNRSCATLRVLAELSKKTQIIFFTHHRHLLELARANLGEDVLFTYSLES
jgi:uncharacterized protein YhaN